MRKIISILFLMCIVSCATTATAAYKDIPDTHWGAPTAKWAVEQGYMAAYDGYFSPNREIPRIDAIVALAAMKGIVDQPATKQLAFEDFSPTQKGYGVVEQLVEQGIIKEQQYFNPQQPITRSQMTKILAMLFQINVDLKNDSKFTDVPVTFWANTYIESLADIGIINNEQERFYPHRTLTKIQLAAFMERTMHFQSQIAEKQVIYDYLQKKYIYTLQHDEQWITEVLSLVNKERLHEDLQPLQLDESLSQLAIVKALDMLEHGYFDHRSPTYGFPWDLAGLFNYRFVLFGENIARRFATPEDVMYAWMNSEKHRSNILKESFTHMGLGVQKSGDGSFYWVQLFSTK